MNEIDIWIFAVDDTFTGTLITKIASIEKFNLSLKTNNLDELFLELRKKTPDLLLFDLELTGKRNGLRTIKSILEANESLKIVVLIDEEDEKVIYSAVCRGAYDYFDKTQPVTNVETKLTEILKSSTPLSGILNNKIKKSFETAGKAGNEFNLTEREQQILNLLIGGLTKRKIAEMLLLSYHTIDSHVRNIYRKLGVQSRSQAITKVLKGNMVEVE